MIRDQKHLRIALLITGAKNMGGAQAHVRDLAVGLRSRGHDCTVLVGPPEGLFQTELRDIGIKVKVLRSFLKPLHPLRDLRAFAELLLELRRMKPDLLAAHTAKAGFLGRLAAMCLGIPCVFTPHGVSIIDRKTGGPQTVFLTLERLAGKFGAKMITVCEAERLLVKQWRILKPEKVAVVHNGIPTSSLTSDQGHEPPVISMVARFDTQKDHMTLLRALAELTSWAWTLRLIGCGPLMHAVEQLATELGIRHRIEFLGERADIPELLSNSQIFVLTTHWEAFPISILEAMRAGLPVVATDVGGIAEAVEDGTTGFLVPPSDYRRLKQSLSVLLEQPSMRVLQGEAGHRRFHKDFEVDSMVTSTLAMYGDMVAASDGIERHHPTPIPTPTAQSTAGR
jgi:glycosyltransferase involved in cell wall biosynthesis